MTRSRHEWLGLVEVSGPFLAAPVLDDVFPQGLDALEQGKPQRLRSAYEEWRDAVDVDDPDLEALHAAWIDEVLATALELYPQVLRRGGAIPAAISATLPEHGVTFGPDIAVVEPGSETALLAVHVFAADVELDTTRGFDGWASTPKDRMVALLRAIDCPLGLVTNGERWLLVHVPADGVTGFASWYARLWAQEPDTLRAFASLLGIRRFFGQSDAKLPKLYERSLTHQDKVTDALGDQVRQAVEVLVQALDRANQDRNGELLRDVEPRNLYEAGLTVMMRLVFLLAAEERGLLLLGEDRYDRFYALSTLRMQLHADSEEILERRRSAWSRLLALSRAVYGGIEHPTLRLPALGGSLFDPDRYVFLEGRAKGTSWRTDPAEPLPIDDRTVLLLLEAIQTFEGRTLSYRALDVEQIGHVYEGLLERTVVRVDDVTLELEASVGARTPSVGLGELESARLDGPAKLVALIKERSGRSEPAIRNGIGRAVADGLAARLLTVCRGDVKLRDRLLPYASLLRSDPWDYPLVRHPGSFVVAVGSDRRDSGTHYTPKNLTEKIVRETLTPLVYEGPSEGRPKSEWRLKTPEHLLDLKICDPAMGSGAFLVQVCRWLADRLVESWADAEAAGSFIDCDGRRSEEAEPPRGRLARDAEERSLLAKRLIVERCIYGVDKNPQAVELAKLSLWLVTSSKGKPFGFLDHNLRTGDSSLGIIDVEQLMRLSFDSSRDEQILLFAHPLREVLEKTLILRKLISDRMVDDIHDVEAMEALDARSRSVIQDAEIIADGLTGISLIEKQITARKTLTKILASSAAAVLQGSEDARTIVREKAAQDLSKKTVDGLARRPFHWPLQFPEVFLREDPGFDAMIGNPPFLGNRLWKGAFGELFQRQCEISLGEPPGKIDLCVVFHRRASDLIRSKGTFGLLATSNIAEGTAIAIGTEKLLANGSIYFAIKGMPWPGSAAVDVAIICFFKGIWSGSANAGSLSCVRIGSRLEAEEAASWEPRKMRNCIYSFEGVNNSKGLALVLSKHDELLSILQAEANHLVRPYITGNDITSCALRDVGRWALDIADRDLGEIEATWPRAHEFLTAVVKPTRTVTALKSYAGLIDRWWQYWNHRAAPMRRLRANDEFVAFSKVTTHPFGMLAPTSWIYTNQVVAVHFSRPDIYALTLTSFFRKWIEKYSGGKLRGWLRISISGAIERYPLPIELLSDQAIVQARRFNDLAVAYSEIHDCGITATIDAMHNQNLSHPILTEMRSILPEIDTLAARAYGWNWPRIEYDFNAIEEGGDNVMRWSPDESVLNAFISDLIDINKERSLESKSEVDGMLS